MEKLIGELVDKSLAVNGGTTLDTLPEELINNVVSLACRPDLAPLSLVCKRLHRIVEPHLYKSVRADFNFHGGLTLDQNSPAFCLLRTLRGRPQLWGYIREITSACEELDPDESSMADDYCNPVLAELVIKSTALEILGLSLYRSYGGIQPYREITGECSQMSCLVFHNFEALRQLDICFNGCAEADWISILSLPHLEALAVHGVGTAMFPRVNNPDWWLNLESPIKNLTLNGFSYRDELDDSSPLARIAGSCPLLESLHVTKSYLFLTDSVGAYRKILALFSKSMVHGHLRKLEVWDSNFYSTSSPDNIIANSVTELRTHEKLEYLEVDVRVLLEKDAEGSVYLDLQLPATLRSLKLHLGAFMSGVGKDDIRKALDQMSGPTLRDRFPQLHTVTIIFEIIQGYHLEIQDGEALKQAFGMHGILCEFQVKHYMDENDDLEYATDGFDDKDDDQDDSF